jgi:hypothetical protein
MSEDFLENFKLGRIFGHERLGSYYVFSYHFMDSPWPFFSLDENEYLNGIAIKDKLTKWFEKIGWHGDGEIQTYYLLPWMVGNNDGHCMAAYHVKQQDNGTSFFAVPKSFGFEINKDIDGVFDVLEVPCIDSVDYVFTFGKYKGYSIHDVFLSDGFEYLKWLDRNDVVSFSWPLLKTIYEYSED